MRFLPRDLLGGECARELLRFFHWNILAVRLFDLHLDGHAMAIPARHVRRVKTRKLLALDDNILEDFVYRVPDVNVAIGVGRPIVQHETRAATAGIPNRLVNLTLLPISDPPCLAAREIPAHRKRRVGQVQRAFVVGLVVF